MGVLVTQADDDLKAAKIWKRKVYIIGNYSLIEL